MPFVASSKRTSLAWGFLDVWNQSSDVHAFLPFLKAGHQAHEPSRMETHEETGKEEGERKVIIIYYTVIEQVKELKRDVGHSISRKNPW